MGSKKNFTNLVRALEILLKGAAVLCWVPFIYAVFLYRDAWFCSILDFPGCGFFSTNIIFVAMLPGLASSILWSLAIYIGKFSYAAKGKPDNEIIQDFGRFLTERAPEAGIKFYDLKILPYAKPRIREALLAGFASAYKNDDTQNLNVLESTLLLTLPHFQRGVGKKPIYSGNEEATDTRETNLIYQWHVKKVTEENLGAVEMNYKIESNHNAELIKKLKQ